MHQGAVSRHCCTQWVFSPSLRRRRVCIFLATSTICPLLFASACIADILGRIWKFFLCIFFFVSFRVVKEADFVRRWVFSARMDDFFWELLIWYYFFDKNFIVTCLIIIFFCFANYLLSFCGFMWSGWGLSYISSTMEKNIIDIIHKSSHDTIFISHLNYYRARKSRNRRSHTICLPTVPILQTCSHLWQFRRSWSRSRWPNPELLPQEHRTWLCFLWTRNVKNSAPQEAPRSPYAP